MTLTAEEFKRLHPEVATQSQIESSEEEASLTLLNWIIQSFEQKLRDGDFVMVQHGKIQVIEVFVDLPVTTPTMLTDYMRGHNIFDKVMDHFINLNYRFYGAKHGPWPEQYRIYQYLLPN